MSAKHTEGVAQIYVQSTPTADDAKREFERLVDGTVAAGGFSGETIHVVIDNGPPDESLCIGSAGCGPKSRANAARLALCWNEHEGLVEALDKLAHQAAQSSCNYVENEWGREAVTEAIALLARLRSSSHDLPLPFHPGRRAVLVRRNRVEREMSGSFGIPGPIARLGDLAKERGISPTDAMVLLLDSYEAARPTEEALRAENERLQALCDRLKMEAEGHAGEARGANATIYEIYQICTGATGEPGNWHGAEPVRKVVGALRAEVERLTRLATDRAYLASAYRNMLGPKGREVADMWESKGVTRTHVDWGPGAAEMTGEDRAEVLLVIEATMDWAKERRASRSRPPAEGGRGMSEWWKGRAHDQDTHARINAQHYPGTRQLCSQCDTPTNRCEDDALFVGDAGPLCESCAEIASTVQCEQCVGSGEIITDWNRYLNGQPGDVGDEGTADCPNCDGRGRHVEDGSS